MFFDCSSLQSLPDISKWAMNNIININSIFCYCCLLSYLSDISKWNLKNLNINNIFKGCSSLITIPDITKWKKNNKIFFDEKEDIFSIDSIILRNSYDKINPIISDNSSEMNSSYNKKDNKSS